MHRYGWLVLALLLVALSVGVTCISTDAADKIRQHKITTWGGDHVGQSFPEYVTGDECLFCHRRDIGPTWNDNPHQQTIRRATQDDPAVAALKDTTNREIDTPDFLLGSKRLTRFLRRSHEYGKVDLLTALFRPHPGGSHGQMEGTQSARWDAKTFADRCAGCHTTAVDANTGSFAATSLDCFTCHGDVDLAHTTDSSHIFLSKTNRNPQEIISTCGQCHLRGGHSHSTGKPYPNTFVAGDNLFHDFDVDLSDDAIDILPAIEQHIFLNCRDVATGADTTITCLSCHNVHDQCGEKHQQLELSKTCSTCHTADMELIGALRATNTLETHNTTCDY